MNIFSRIEAIFGSPIAVSRALGHSSRQVWNNWKRRGQIPAEDVLRVCAATNWLIQPEEIRPEVFDKGIYNK